jgi:hypothetical protein
MVHFAATAELRNAVIAAQRRALQQKARDVEHGGKKMSFIEEIK